MNRRCFEPPRVVSPAGSQDLQSLPCSATVYNERQGWRALSSLGDCNTLHLVSREMGTFVERVELLSQLHRPLYIGEENGHLLAFAFEGASRGEDLLGEMLRGVRARVASRRCLRCLSERLPPFATKSFTGLIASATRDTGESQSSAALGAELPALSIVTTAGSAPHRRTACPTNAIVPAGHLAQAEEI